MRAVFYVRLFSQVLAFFRQRGDNQIMSLELLSIAFGMSCFEELIAGRNVHIHSDNTGAECATRKGGAREFDHTCVVHSIWYFDLLTFICLMRLMCVFAVLQAPRARTRHGLVYQSRSH